MNQQLDQERWIYPSLTKTNTSNGTSSASRDKFTILFNASSDALLICRQEEWRIVDANERFAQRFGYAREEARGATLDSLKLFLHADDSNRIKIELTRQGFVRDRVVKMRSKANGVHHVRLTFEEIVNDGRACWLVLLQERETRQETVNSFFLSEAQTRALLEIMPTAMFMCNSEGLITYYNQRATELWGRCPKILDPEDRYCGSFRIYRPDGTLLPHAECPMAVAVLSGRGTRHEEIQFERPDGTTIAASVNVDPLYDANGCRIGAINVFEDITLRKQAVEALQTVNVNLEQHVAERTRQLEQKNVELERSNHELDQFAYVASHDLKAPLRAITQLAHWIGEDAIDVLPQSSKSHLAKLLKRIERLEQLLDDLLTYSRAGRQRHSPEPVDAAALVRDVVNILAPPEEFVVQIDDSMPTFSTERVPLETALRNLIGNAVKHHSRSDGRVQVTIEDRGDVLEFAVSDDGPGIEEQFHDRIFQVFQTLQPRDQVEGSGMGLAIVKKLVETRGGAIWVESDPDRGTTFRFTWSK